MHLFRIIVATAIAVALVFSMSATDAPPAEAGKRSAADRVVAYARSHLGKPYRLGTEGLRRFDCSGLVYRVFKQAGLLRKVGNRRMLARGYFRWFKRRGLVVNRPKVGDLVVWGRRKVSHIGIYIGRDRRGRPMAISALVGGVKRHRVHAVTIPFKGYLRVRMAR